MEFARDGATDRLAGDDRMLPGLTSVDRCSPTTNAGCAWVCRVGEFQVIESESSKFVSWGWSWASRIQGISHEIFARVLKTIENTFPMEFEVCIICDAWSRVEIRRTFGARVRVGFSCNRTLNAGVSVKCFFDRFGSAALGWSRPTIGWIQTWRPLGCPKMLN